MNDQFRKYKIKIIDEYIEQKWICKDKLKAKSKFEYDAKKKNEIKEKNLDTVKKMKIRSRNKILYWYNFKISIIS